MKKTNRRNFLKTLTGLLTIPTGLCLAKSKQQKSNEKMIGGLLNYDNIKTNGTFKQWIQSIANDIQRLLDIKSKEPDARWYEYNCCVKIKSCMWGQGIGANNLQFPAFVILIYTGSTKIDSLSFAEFEFDKYHKNSKKLQQLLQCRFLDCVWSMYHSGREHTIILKKFGIDCSKPCTDY